MSMLDANIRSFSDPKQARDDLRLALPEPSLCLNQDEEWCLVECEDGWREIRFHDYADMYEIPGLYERVFYDILKCNSPATIRELLAEEVSKAGGSVDELRVLDLGAGNGMVGEELVDEGAELAVGVDITPSAKRAAFRDRPEVYADYLIADMTDLSDPERHRLKSHVFNCLTCVAALGFGDIPVKAFAESFNLIAQGGWVAFNIKEDFLNGTDSSGFSRFVHKMIEDGMLSVRRHKRYRHRIATSGESLFYVAIVGIKNRNVLDVSS